MDTASVVVIAWSALAALFTVVTWIRLGRLKRAVEPALPSPPPPVLVLRPMDAPTPSELDALASPIDYPGALEQVVLSPFPPSRLPQGVRWLFSDPITRNRKAGHLVYALSVLPTEGRVVLSIDSDVAVDGALVRGLVAPVAAGATLVTASWVPQVSGGLGARCIRAMLVHTHHSFLALSVMSIGVKAVSGKALGLSPDALRELPGVVDHIGEDLELARRVHARGGSIALTLAPARVPHPASTVVGAVGRIGRWMRILRAHRPLLYPTVPVFFCPSLPLLVLALVLRSPLALAAVAGLAVLRTALAWRLLALRPGGARGRLDALEWVLGEALLLVGFVRSLFGARVIWRGRAFKLRSGGKMEPAQPAPFAGSER